MGEQGILDPEEQERQLRLRELTASATPSSSTASQFGTIDKYLVEIYSGKYSKMDALEFWKMMENLDDLISFINYKTYYHK